MGSLVKTDKGYLFMSVALGKTVVKGDNSDGIVAPAALRKIVNGIKNK